MKFDITPVVPHPIDCLGDRLPSVRDVDTGRVLLCVKSACKNVGLDHRAQYRRLANVERSPWVKSRVVRMDTRDATGRLRRMLYIDVEGFLMWISNISTGNIVDPAVREKLRRYQSECPTALAAYFLPKAPPPATVAPAPTGDPIIDSLMTVQEVYDTQEALIVANRRALTAIVGVRRAQLALEIKQQESDAKLAETVARLDGQQADLTQAMRTAEAALYTQQGNTGYIAMIGYMLKTGRPAPHEVVKANGATASRMCRHRGIRVGTAHHPVWGHQNTYPEELLAEFFGDKPNPKPFDWN